MKYLFLSIIATGFLSSLAHGTESDAGKYRKCMSLVDSSASEATIYATDWILSGGGIPAGHCKALGLLGAGKAIEAANLLEKLVEDMAIKGNMNPDDAKKNAGLRVQLYAQAALAWKEAGQDDTSYYDKSYMAYSSALSAIVGDVFQSKRALFHELYLARGTLQILRGQYKAAVEDFTLAIDKDSQQFEGFLQRAKAYRKRRMYMEARLDLKIAAKLEAAHPGILLESGIVFRAQEKKSEARRVWQELIDLYPKSDYAALARTNLDLLDL
ncbi:MAG: hypothetical protein JKY91_01225 [Emcibacter sp.]|nr:hypothetical protein [Emcibacter sp.]